MNYYVEDHENGPLRANGSGGPPRTDKQPLLVTALTSRAGNTQDDHQTSQLVAASLTSGSHPESNMPGRRREDDVNLAVVPISGDAFRGEGEAKTPSADAEGNVRLRDPGLGVGEEGDPAFTLAAASPGAVGVRTYNVVPEGGQGADLRVSESDVSLALSSVNGQAHDRVSLGVSAAGVRRLTPVECERLQGLPDGWTDVPEGAPDSRRYSSLGDAVTANVAEWIGRRLLELELA